MKSELGERDSSAGSLLIVLVGLSRVRERRSPSSDKSALLNFSMLFSKPTTAAHGTMLDVRYSVLSSARLLVLKGWKDALGILIGRFGILWSSLRCRNSLKVRRVNGARSPGAGEVAVHSPLAPLHQSD